jgi:hypothetical protein
LTTEEILSEWKKDSQVDRSELGDKSSSLSSYHSKYIEQLFLEKAKYIKQNSAFSKLKKLRWEYWNGLLSKTDLEANNWPPQSLKILRQDIPMYLEADDVLVDTQLRLSIQKEKVELLESIIKHIGNFGFNVRAAIEFEKFKFGQ